jgi:hypothetical protein
MMRADVRYEKEINRQKRLSQRYAKWDDDHKGECFDSVVPYRHIVTTTDVPVDMSPCPVCDSSDSRGDFAATEQHLIERLSRTNKDLAW